MRVNMHTGERTGAVRSLTVAAAAAVFFLMTSCTGTTMVAQWRDDGSISRPAKVFVAGMLDERGPRTLLEDEFVRQLKYRGISAVAGYTVFSAGPRPLHAEVLRKAQELGADTILVARFLRQDAAETHKQQRRRDDAPRRFETSWDENTGMSEDIAARDVSPDYDVITMDTTLYRVATGAPIWRGLSETTYKGGSIRQIRPLTAAVVRQLVNALMDR